MSAKLLPDAAPIASRSAPEVKGKGKLTSSSDPRLLRPASSSSTTKPPPIEKYMRLTNISPSPSRAVKLSALLWKGWRCFIWKCRRSEEHTSELQSLMRISYAVFCLEKKKKNNTAVR